MTTPATQTFAALKTAAQNATTFAELYRVAATSNDKYNRNVRTAQMMAHTHGRAAEADHYFQNVLPGWAAINKEIHAMMTRTMVGKSTEEIRSLFEGV